MNVIWLAIREENPPRGYWDHGLIDRLLERFECEHQELRAIPEGAPGSVVIIPARNQAVDVEAINGELAKLPWCVVILSGDEESVFPWRELRHPNMRVWVMSPKQGQHDDAANRIGSGYRYEEPDLLRDIGLQARELDFFFSGQITHPIREQCAEALRTMPNGKLNETAGFGQGVDYPEYIRDMASAKFVPAPSGPVSPDNFRLYEALEAGAVPIGDGGGYWAYLLGETPPFPVVSDWSVLPGLMPQLLRDWPHNANVTFAWWQRYKRRMADKLEDQVREVSGTAPRRVMSSDITVLMSTSPVQSHPSTKLIEQTIASIRERLPHSEIILMIDGVKPENLERKAAYEEYIRRLLWLTNNQLANVTPLLSETHIHQTGMTREALKLVRTPLVLFTEHDTPLVGEIDWEGLSAVVTSGYANTIRLHHETRIHPEHEYLMLDKQPQDILGVPLMRTMQWSQRPHLSSTAYYRNICETYFTDQPMFVEHVMYGAVLSHPWNDARLHLYAPEGSLLRSTHLNGRDYVDPDGS